MNLTMDLKRESFSTGKPLEMKVGYSRMIKIGNYVRIGGTAAVNQDGTTHAPYDAYEQAKFVLNQFLSLLEQVEATPADVCDIRCFAVGDPEDGFARAYMEIFGQYRPLATKIGVAQLSRPELLVELECEAYIGSGQGEHALRRESFASGGPVETKVGYSRMIKIGNYVRIGGTGPINADRTIYAPYDAYEQTKCVLNRFISLLEQAGASPDDVHGIRCYAVGDPEDGISKAFNEIFGKYRPIGTKIGVAELFSSEMLVELECEAYIGSGQREHALYRESFSSGSPLEIQVGYSRMIKIGNYIRIGGTAAINLDGTIHAPYDAYEQARFIMNQFMSLLEQAGASAADVYGIRCFAVGDSEDGFGKAFSEIFGKYRPIGTKIGISRLNYPELLVELECEAYIGSGVPLA